MATQKVTTEKITAFNRPHNVKTVKSFLGLCNYYRPFVPNFADMAKPMNRLLKKEVSFEWSEMCEEAFQQLKKLLTSPPLLIHPDIGGHFHILTDASDAACGAAVCHRMNDIYRPVAFWALHEICNLLRFTFCVNMCKGSHYHHFTDIYSMFA